MLINHKILSFAPITGSIQVQYYTDEFPEGFVYNIDIPISENSFVSDEEIASLINLMCPTEQIKRVIALRAIGTPDSLVGFSVAPQETVDNFTKEQQVINQRNVLLAESDYTQLLDVPLSAEEKAAWKEYRQELRDVTKQEGFPSSVVFPISPANEPR